MEECFISSYKFKSVKSNVNLFLAVNKIPLYCRLLENEEGYSYFELRIFENEFYKVDSIYIELSEVLRNNIKEWIFNKCNFNIDWSIEFSNRFIKRMMK